MTSLKQFYVGLILFFSAAVWAAAENCAPRDLRAGFGSVRNQLDKGWCYANVAADLLDYHFKELGISAPPVSSGYLALHYSKQLNSKPDDDGGFVSLALAVAFQKGICSRAIEEDLILRGPEAGSLQKKLKELQRLKQIWDLSKTQNGYSTQYRIEFDRLIYEYRRQGSIFKEIQDTDLNSLFRDSNEDNFLVNFTEVVCKDDKFSLPRDRSKIRWGRTSEYFNYLQFYKKGTVIPGVPIPIPVEVKVQHKNLRWDFPVLDRQLDNYNPVGISYYANFLGADFSEFKSMDQYEKKERHASVLVGRRFNQQTNECEYLIRNSWGSDWKEQGHVWVPRSILKKVFYGYTYLLKK